MQIFSNYLSSLKDFFYPRNCVLCGNPLLEAELEICLNCEANLPVLPYKLHLENPIENHFNGVININGASAYLPYIENGTAQKLIFALKYKGHRDLGLVLGRMAGEHLFAKNPNFKPELIIPVPLHFSKERKRGFNQCYLLAKGLSQIYPCSVFSEIQRIRDSVSQTQKSRYKRFKSVEDIFKVENPDIIRGKEVLLLDDVITTGATLGALAREVMKFKPKKLFIYSISCRL